MPLALPTTYYLESICAVGENTNRWTSIINFIFILRPMKNSVKKLKHEALRTKTLFETRFSVASLFSFSRVRTVLAVFHQP